MNKEDIEAEIAKCKASPYYFALNYTSFGGWLKDSGISEEKFNAKFPNHVTKTPDLVEQHLRKMFNPNSL